MTLQTQKNVKVRVSRLEKVYTDTRGRTYRALKDINLEVYEGEFFCLLGPSGCGKTTLLNIMAGFEKPTAGTVTIDGETVKKPDQNYVVLFQNYGLFPWRSVLGNVEYGLEVRKIPSKDRRERAMELINLVGLEKFIHNHPHELSGGMQQRVSVARALAVDPDIIFMDEPFGALDAIIRLKMQEEITDIWRKKNKTIIFVTHDISEAVYLGDRVAIMSAQRGEISKIFEVPPGRPRNRSNYNLIKTQELIFHEFEISVREDSDYCI